MAKTMKNTKELKLDKVVNPKNEDVDCSSTVVDETEFIGGVEQEDFQPKQIEKAVLKRRTASPFKVVPRQLLDSAMTRVGREIIGAGGELVGLGQAVGRGTIRAGLYLLYLGEEFFRISITDFYVENYRSIKDFDVENKDFRDKSWFIDRMESLYLPAFCSKERKIQFERDVQVLIERANDNQRYYGENVRVLRKFQYEHSIYTNKFGQKLVEGRSTHVNLPTMRDLERMYHKTMTSDYARLNKKYPWIRVDPSRLRLWPN